MLGVRYQVNPINVSDTAELRAALREREGVVPQEDIAGVEFTIQQPNGILAGNPATLKAGIEVHGIIHKPESGNPLNKGYEITALSPMIVKELVPGKSLVRGKNIVPGATVTKVLSETAILIDYESLISEPNVTEEEIDLEFESTQWPGEIEENGEGYLQWTKTEEAGEYLVQAQFTLTTQEVKSVMVNFAVLDPFNIPPPTEAQLVAEEVWLRFEDSFDSVEGGPILRDYTLAHFDLKKIERFIPEALLDINVQMPPTQYSISYFARRSGDGEINPLMPLLSKGTSCVRCSCT